MNQLAFCNLSADSLLGFSINVYILVLMFSVFLFCFVLAFNLDNEQPDYDMDSEDETLLNRLNRKMEIKPLQFEIMIDRLEKASSNQVLCSQRRFSS